MVTIKQGYICQLTIIIDVRKDLAVGEHSFTEIAKIVGERWQVLDVEEKEGYEENAAKAKSRYNDEMTDYVKTAEYKSYQEYLNKWHARQTEIQAEKSKFYTLSVLLLKTIFPTVLFILY